MTLLFHHFQIVLISVSVRGCTPPGVVIKRWNHQRSLPQILPEAERNHFQTLLHKSNEFIIPGGPGRVDFLIDRPPIRQPTLSNARTNIV